MTKLLNTFLFYLSLSTCAQAFEQQTSVNSNNQSTYEKKYSEIIAADHAMQEGDIKKAIFFYKEYFKKNTNNKDVLITLFRLYLAEGNYYEANKLLSFYLNKFGTDGIYLAQKAQYLVALNKSEEARRTMFDQKTYRLTSILNSAKYAIRNKKYKKAMELYQQYLRENPNDKAAMLMLIRLQLIHGSVERAEELLSDYLDKFDKDDNYLTEKARYFALTNRPEKALTILGPLIKKNPSNKVLLYIEQYALNYQVRKNHEMILDEAKYAIQNNDIKKAIRFYHLYLSKNPNNKTVSLAVIRLQLALGNMQAAQKMLATYSDKFGVDDAYSIEQARYLTLTNKIEDALALLEILAKKNPANKSISEIKQYALKIKARQAKAAIDLALITQAKKAIQQEDYQKGVAFYQEYLRNNPNDKQVTLTVIQVQLMQKNLEAANSWLSNYAKRFGKDYNYYLEKSHYFVLIKKPDQALEILVNLQKKNFSDKKLLTLKQHALNIKAQQRNAELTLLLTSAKKSLQEKEYKKAIELYHLYLTKNPNDKATTLTLIDLELQQANYASVEKLFYFYSKQFGKDDACLTEQARYFILLERPEEALTILTTLQKKNPSDKKLLALKQYALNIKLRHKNAPATFILTNAKQAKQNKEYKRAIALYRLYLTQHPNDRVVILALIDLELQQKNYAGVAKLLSSYAQQFGKDDAFLTLNARYLVLIKKSEEALAILDLLLKEHPLDKILLDTKRYALNSISHSKNVKQNHPSFTVDTVDKTESFDDSFSYQKYLNDINEKAAMVAKIQSQFLQSNFAEVDRLLANYSDKYGEDASYIVEKNRNMVYSDRSQQPTPSLLSYLKNNPGNKQVLSNQDTITPDINAPSNDEAKPKLAGETSVNSSLLSDATSNAKVANETKANPQLAAETSVDSSLLSDATSNAKVTNETKAKPQLAAETSVNSSLLSDATSNAKVTNETKAKAQLAAETSVNSTLVSDATSNAKVANETKAKPQLAAETSVNSSLLSDATSKTQVANETKAKPQLAAEASVNSSLLSDAASNAKVTNETKAKPQLAAETSVNSTLVSDATSKDQVANETKAKPQLAAEASVNSTLANDKSLQSKPSDTTKATPEVTFNATTKSNHTEDSYAQSERRPITNDKSESKHRDLNVEKDAKNIQSQNTQTTSIETSDRQQDRRAITVATSSKQQVERVSHKKDTIRGVLIRKLHHPQLLPKSSLLSLWPHSYCPHVTYKCHYPNFYMGGQLAYAKLQNHDKDDFNSSNDDGLATRMYTGFNFTRYFALELGATVYPDQKATFLNESAKIQQESIEFLGKATLPLTCNLSLDAKAGEGYLHRHGNVLLANHFDTRESQIAQKVDFSENSIRPLLGVGISYALTVYLSANMTYMHLFNETNHFDGINVYGIGITFNFK